jgi:hypothetical protein
MHRLSLCASSLGCICLMLWTWEPNKSSHDKADVLDGFQFQPWTKSQILLQAQKLVTKQPTWNEEARSERWLSLDLGFCQERPHYTQELRLRPQSATLW